MSFVRAAARSAFVVIVAAVVARPARAQQPSPAATGTPVPDVGQMAPDFTVSGATRYGLLKSTFRLSEYRGQTIVLSFFPAARTKG